VPRGVEGNLAAKPDVRADIVRNANKLRSLINVRFFYSSIHATHRKAQ